MSLRGYQRLAFVALVGLFVVFLFYIFTRQPSQRTLLLALTVLPLVMPIRGILAGNPYTYAYSSLLSSGYFLLCSWLYLVYLDWVRYLMLFGVALSLLWFFSCLIHNKKLKHQKNRKRNSTD